MWWKISLLCCAFLSNSVAISLSFDNILENSVSIFATTWKNGTVTDRQSFQQSVYDLLGHQPGNQTLITVKGFISFADGDFDASVASFREVCDLAGYDDATQIGRLAEVLEISDKYGAVNTLVAALQKRNDSSYTSNVPLFQRLINTFAATKGKDESYGRLIHVIRSLPSTYGFWIQYADAHLTRYFGLPRESNQPKARHTSWNALELYFLYYGLTLFPRCPELLYLRALHNIADGDLACAYNFAQRALETRYLQYGILKSVYYSDLVAYLDDTVKLESTDSAKLNHTCMPNLLHHNVEDYQRAYKALRAAASSDASLQTDRSEMQTSMDVFSQSVHVREAYLFSNGNIPMVQTTRYLPSLQVGCSSHTECARPGFFVADAAPSITTHFVTQAYNLSMVQNASMGLLYSSHTLEHLSHENPPPSCATYPLSSLQGDTGCFPELNLALSEWRRVLAPNGKILLSVPDLTALASYFVNPNSSMERKMEIRRILYGGQVDQYDFHKNGFYFEYLRDLLIYHKFCDIERVKSFGLFRDASYKSERVSLSVQGRAC